MSKIFSLLKCKTTYTGLASIVSGVMMIKVNGLSEISILTILAGIGMITTRDALLKGEIAKKK